MLSLKKTLISNLNPLVEYVESAHIYKPTKTEHKANRLRHPCQEVRSCYILKSNIAETFPCRCGVSGETAKPVLSGSGGSV